jgi:lysophospholipase L1-like esterase
MTALFKKLQKKKHASASKIGILVVGIAACGLTLEIGLRMILGLGSPVLFEFDSNFGAYPKSNQHLHRFFVRINTNQYGMRSPPVASVKEDGDYRILFVGDSVPFGTTYVDQADIFVERMGGQLRINGKTRAIVMNGSSPGWAPSNELGFLKTRGLYAADMVVLVYNTKDLTQSFSQYQESPIMPLENPPSAIGELWQRYLMPRIVSARAVVDPGSTSADGRPVAASEKVMETIEATRRLVESHGARFVILFLPIVTQDVRRYQSDWDQAIANLRRWAVGRGVPILDMSAVMSARDPAAIYFDGVHLRPAGDKLVADAFIKWFNAEPLVAAREPTRPGPITSADAGLQSLGISAARDQIN